MSNPCSSFWQQETEDQDDDFVAGLVEQMAHSTLDEEDEDGDGNFSWPEQDESPSAANAAAATAAAAAAWPPLRDLSAQRRSGWSSTKSSPSPAVSPPTPLRNFSHESRSGDAWELLHLAAKEVMRLKAAASSSSPPPSSSYSRDEILAYNRAAMYHSSAKASGGSSGDSCGNKPVGSTSFAQLDWKQQQRSTQRHHSCYQNVSNPITWNRRVRSLQNQHQARQLANLRNAQSASSNRSGVHHPAAAPSSQQWGAAAAGGSGMRAVFLRGPGFGSSTSNGTGVFLPQATTTTSSTSRDRDQKRKPTCSTVLLPSRIVEVLNLNVDDLNRQPTAVANNDLPGSGSSSNSSDEYLNAHLSKSYSACSPTRWHSAAEHALPTEWTY